MENGLRLFDILINSGLMLGNFMNFTVGPERKIVGESKLIEWQSRDIRSIEREIMCPRPELNRRPTA